MFLKLLLCNDRAAAVGLTCFVTSFSGLAMSRCSSTGLVLAKLMLTRETEVSTLTPIFPFPVLLVVAWFCFVGINQAFHHCRCACNHKLNSSNHNFVYMK